MLPRDFLTTHGAPTVRVLQIPGGGSVDIPANPDRYLLWFFASQQPFSLSPIGAADETTAANVCGNTPQVNQKLTHATDGAVVNLGYRVRSTVANEVIVIEGRMRPARRLGREPINE